MSKRSELPMPIVRVVTVECHKCGYRFKAPKGCIWPCACPRCEADAAPVRWLKENGLK